jgi:thiol:disulfide interchange protein DsbA
MLKLKKLPLLVVALFGYLCIMLTFTGSMTTAYGSESTLVPTYGSGSYQMLIFSDYFCQPCQKLEKLMDKEIEELLANGSVKVSFVDLPIYKLTSLYARYFLYAANASKSYKEVLLARKVLFDTASRIGAITEPQLENALKSRNIPLKPYDVKPVFKQYNDIVRKYQVRGTPNIVFVYSSTDIRKYSGDKDIKKGVSELRTAQGRPQK